jgi:SAM-dependent methyltransferase
VYARRWRFRRKVKLQSGAAALNFQKYSTYYDLLYADKDYTAEAGYVERTLRGAKPTVHTVLELGSGTGRHGRLLAEMGFDIYGIERSSEMAAIARSASENESCRGSFTCEVGDLRIVRLGRTVDAVVSLFHVISYQTTDDDLRAAFRTAAAHLEKGGLFLFDVWHGPAVAATEPSIRTKEVTKGRYRVKRVAYPERNAATRTVKVVYALDCEDIESGERTQFQEEHVMRYLFAPEIEKFASDAGFTLIGTEEFLTGRTPSEDTWGVAYLLKKGENGEK